MGYHHLNIILVGGNQDVGGLEYAPSTGEFSGTYISEKLKYMFIEKPLVDINSYSVDVSHSIMDQLFFDEIILFDINKLPVNQH
jgi:hypothetical protein